MRIGSQLFLVIASCWIAASAHAAPKIFLSLRDRVVLAEASLHLSDVASIETSDATLVRRLSAVTIAGLSRGGATLSLTQEDVSRQVLAAIPEVAGQIVWGSNPKVLIEGMKTTTSIAPGVDAAAAAVGRALGGLGVYELDYLGALEMIAIPPGRPAFVPKVNSLRRRGDEVDVPLQVFVDGQLVETRELRFRIKRFDAFARRQAPKLPSVLSDTVPRTEQVSSVDAGARAVAESPIASEPETKVRLIAESGDLRIETDGVALSEPVLGERIRVRRAGSQSELVGRVIEPGIVAIGNHE